VVNVPTSRDLTLPLEATEPVQADTDAVWALRQFTDPRRYFQYTESRNYYDGNHRLAFATESFRQAFGSLFSAFAENMCPAVVDAVGDRLELTGFESTTKTTTTTTVPSPIPDVPARSRVEIEDDLGQRAWDLWEDLSMDVKSKEVHRESLTMGDGYVIVWPDDDMNVQVWSQDAENMAVEYDENHEGRVLRAAKLWQIDDGRYRLNIYLPDRIRKLVTTTVKRVRPSINDAKAFTQFEPDVANPYGVVPVFHFPNRNVARPGTSELRDVVPLQDGLNKSVADMLVTMEYAAFKQRYVIGLEVELDPQTGLPMEGALASAGVDRMLAIPDIEAKVGQFDATDLGQFLKVQEKFWASAARVSGTPLHYFYIVEGDFPSGEAMKSAEARFVKKITDRQKDFGKVWREVMRFCLYVEGDLNDSQFQKPVEDGGVKLTCVWAPAEPRSQTEIADTAVKKKAVGVSPSQILKELGYDDETIDRMLEELAAQQMANQVLQTPSPAPNVPDSKQRRATRDAERETQGDNRSNATRARAGAQPGA
jgi:hypothetical protein